MKKKLFRSETDNFVGGVMGGLGEYMDVDANILRLAFLLIVIATGIFPFVIAYILAVIILPLKLNVIHTTHSKTHTYTKNSEPEVKHEEQTDEIKEEPKENVIN